MNRNHPTPIRRRGSCAGAALLMLLGCSGIWESESKGPYDTDPLEPEAALQSFEIVEGFRIETFASEPHVVDPVEMAWDENGGIYVAEMLDYPFDPESGEPPRSRIRYLEDADSDGRIDKATIFADNLLQVTSVLPWKGGVFATAAPDIVWLKDSDGDQVADVKEIWYTGFQSHEVSPESRITNLRFGLDNWIYAANNGRSGEIRSPKFPGKPAVLVRGYDFRFHPLTGDFAPAGGPTQFGMSFNQWGDRFVTQNTVHLRHVVLPARYVLRNSLFAPDSMLHYVPEDDPRESIVYPLTEPQQWRIERTQIRQERYDETQPGRKELVGGHFTAATGNMIYLGDAFPENFYGNVFVADANGNLVRYEVLTPKGVTYKADPWPRGREFLASRDTWFRPVNTGNAPDGNLYVMDFYREYIEEPASIPAAIKERLQLNFYRGDDRGRIYRIRPENPRVARGLDVPLGGASEQQLVQTLAHPNGWHRRAAQRLLLERQDGSVAEALREMATSHESPEARLHALWALQGAGSIEADDVRAALKDEHPMVRVHALRLAEFFLPELASAVVALQADEDVRVQFQLVLTLGFVDGNERQLAPLIARHAGDPWFRAALVTSIGERPFRLLTRLVTRHREFFSTEEGSAGTLAGRQEFLRQLCALIGAQRRRDELTMFFITLDGSARFRAPEWRAAALEGLARGLAIERTTGLRVQQAEAILAKFLGGSEARVREAAFEAARYFYLPGLVAEAVSVAANDDLEIERRARAVRFLRGGQFSRVEPVLRKILTSPSPQAVQEAAVETLASFDQAEVGEILLSGWPGYGPQVRLRVAETMIRRRLLVDMLLDAVEQGRVRPDSIDAVSRIRLSDHPDEDVRERAQALLGEQTRTRAEVVEQHRDVIEMEADAERGRAAFEKECAKCHVRQAERGRIGPDLSGVNNKTREELLTHILDPSFQIEPNYTNYMIIDQDGRMYDGLLVGETAEAVTLRGETADVTILRKNIAEMRASSVSLMPDGIEEGMTKQELADVIAYLRAGL